jgi:hypothetical protein
VAKNNFSLDFKGFLDLAYDISEQYGDEKLLEATAKALDESRKYVNIKVGQAMKESPYSFKAGEGYSQGDARKSLIKVSQMPVEVNGTEVTVVAGVDLSEAPEALMLAKGTPHLSADKNLMNALKCKGKVRKQVDKIQADMFNAVMEGKA